MRKASSPQFATAREAVLALPSRARVLVSQACGAPMSLLQALADERDHFQALELCTGVLFTDYPILPCISENITLTTWQVSAPVQALADQGKLEYLPLRLSQVPKTFSPDGALPVDAVLIQVSTPDRNGYVSMGVTVSTMIDASRQAPLVIAEVNRQAPRTMGNTFLHMSEIDYLVDADYPGVEYRPVSLGDVERTIAQYVTELIPDGATIQSGLGAIPEALLFLLDGKKDLGVHSGMVTDGLLPLIEKGVINNSRKSIDRHKVVIGEVMGSRETIRYVHENPMMHFDSANYTHNPQVIGRIENFVAINSAVEIDLGGQVAAESIGRRQISGLGGQFDFVEGASTSPGGFSIFAMPSTASRGKVSRIVSQLAPGSVVSTPRYLTDYVVTEYGVAYLKGKTMRQRAEALTGVAHPDFRDGLSDGQGKPESEGQ